MVRRPFLLCRDVVHADNLEKETSRMMVAGA